jgi:hypothetical protein
MSFEDKKVIKELIEELKKSKVEFTSQEFLLGIDYAIKVALSKIDKIDMEEEAQKSKFKQMPLF